MSVIKKYKIIVVLGILIGLSVWALFFAASTSFYGYAQVTNKEEVNGTYHISFDGVEESEIRIRENETFEYEIEPGQVEEVTIGEVWGTIETGNDYFLNKSRSQIPDYWRIHKFYSY
ncbi:hypothetical protein [Alkalibacterium sp.]|nr:MAG: hypothetical protein EA249_09680 [Alkalibacterium sp.]